MESMPAVSVVIPARNAAHTIGRQLDAVCQQSLDEPFEVIVVDNGSTDNTVEVVRAFSAPPTMVRLVEGPVEPNRSAARNLGVSEARGDILVFCDADDVVQPRWLRTLRDGAADNGVVTGSLVRVGDDGSADGDAGPAFGTTYRGVACLAAGNFAIRRAAYEAAGGFSDAFRHRVDVEFACRLLLRGVEVTYLPEAQVNYVRRSSTWRSMRQHYWWAVADAQLLSVYRGQIELSYSWRNSLKHWLRIGPALLRAVVRRRELAPHLRTAAALTGRLYGSLRYRTWAI